MMLAALLLMAPPAPMPAPGAPAVSIVQTRAALAGRWTGKLEYRDYQADRWFGLPVTVTIEAVDTGRTLIRKAAFDDGPATGTVWIVTTSLFDPASGREQSASFRAGRALTLESTTIRLASATDAEHWTLIDERDGMDDDRPARIRETTVRDGATMVTVKEVDFTDDKSEAWLTRNRTTLVRDQATP